MKRFIDSFRLPRVPANIRCNKAGKALAMLVLVTVLLIAWFQLRPGRPGSYVTSHCVKFPGSLRQYVLALVKLKAQRLVYNRVPRCGSSSLCEVLETFCRGRSRAPVYLHGQIPSSNRFRFLSEHMDKLEKVRQYLRGQKPPFIYEQHVNYLDLKISPDPLFINVIRDPLDRLASEYRFQKEMSLRNSSFSWPSNTGFKSDMDEIFGRNFEYFCGQSPHCREDSDYALWKARDNVKRHFLLIGTTDKHREFCEVLEFLLPKQFEGLTLHYNKTHKHLNKMKNKGFFSPELTPQLRKLQRREKLFYYFVENRFHKLLNFSRTAKAQGYLSLDAVTRHASFNFLLKFADVLPTLDYMEQY